MIRGAAEHVALRLALPEPGEVATLAPSSDRSPESVRLLPVESALRGRSPWQIRTAGALSQTIDPLFFALKQRATEARGSTVLEGSSRAELHARLDVVLAMTTQLEQLSGLSARVERERGRRLRA
jgi:hypothetical protein